MPETMDVPTPSTATTGAVIAMPQQRLLGGMAITPCSLDCAASLVASWAGAGEHRFVVTPNVDHYVRWRKDPEFRCVYERADLAVLDGAPLVALTRRLNAGCAVERVTGVDLFDELCHRAPGSYAISIVGGADGVALDAAHQLQRRISGIEMGLVTSPTPDQLHDPDYLTSLGERLRAVGSQVVALCLGSPKQEFFYRDLADRCGTDLPGVFMGVGAAVDFIAGRVDRAPHWVRAAGIEWAYRLLREPGRLWHRYLVEDVAFLGYAAQILRAERAR